MAGLELNNIAKSFDGLSVIKDVSFSVAEGEIVGLIGPNGAGKTTLFSIISGFLRPSKGEVYFAGRRIDRLAPPEVCQRGLCRTFQIVRPFGDMSVLENVEIGALLHHRRPAEARRRAAAVLERVGLAGRADQKARTLTLAARKRLEVAKALATEPRLLLLDEVMAGLTRVETAEMLDLLRGLNAEGLSVLLIEHNMQAMMTVSHRVIVLHHGVKIADDPPEAVTTDPAVIAAYLGEEEKEDG